MASFCNPTVFESPAHFRKYYDKPILAGREPGAADKEVQLAAERQEEMNKHCNDFILRRTNDILSDHLPPKVTVLRLLRPQTSLHDEPLRSCLHFLKLLSRIYRLEKAMQPCCKHAVHWSQRRAFNSSAEMLFPCPLNSMPLLQACCADLDHTRSSAQMMPLSCLHLHCLCKALAQGIGSDSWTFCYEQW